MNASHADKGTVLVVQHVACETLGTIEVDCPRDATYNEAWNVFPAALKGPLEQPGRM